MRPKGSAEELERRRRRAVALLRAGQGATEVARMVGADRRSVYRWAERADSGGLRALKSTPHPGRRPKLTGVQSQRLSRELLRGPLEHGFETDLWTGPRVGVVIRRLFGVRYHPEYVPRLLRRLGWSPQKPESRAYERDEREIRRWVRQEWPRIKKRRSP